MTISDQFKIVISDYFLNIKYNDQVHTMLHAINIISDHFLNIKDDPCKIISNYFKIIIDNFKIISGQF